MGEGILTEEINEMLLSNNLCEKHLAEAGVPSNEEVFDQIVNGIPIKYKIVPNNKGRAEIEAMIPSKEEMKRMFVGGV